MNAYQNLKTKLDKEGIKYEELKHKPVYTSEEAAKARKTLGIHQGAKALIMWAKYKDRKDPIMVVVPGDYKFKANMLKKELKCKDIRFQTPDEVEELTGIEIGAIHPFGSLFGLKTYCEEDVLENEEIVFNAGDHGISFVVRAEDYERVERPVVGKWGVEMKS